MCTIGNLLDELYFIINRKQMMRALNRFFPGVTEQDIATDEIERIILIVAQYEAYIAEITRYRRQQDV